MGWWMDHLHAYHRAPFHARGEIGGLLVRSALDFVSRGGYVVSAFTGQTSPSSRGLGHHPFKVATRVRIPLGTPTFFHTKMCLFSMPWCYQHWVIWRYFRILCDKMCDTFGRPCPPEPSLLILNIPFPCRGRLRIVPKRLSALSRTSLIFLSRSPSYRGHLHHRPLQTSQSPC